MCSYPFVVESGDLRYETLKKVGLLGYFRSVHLSFYDKHLVHLKEKDKLVHFSLYSNGQM